MPRKKAVTVKSTSKQNPSPSVSVKFSKAVRDFWENLAWSDIVDSFGTKTTQRGRDYANSGHVQNLWATEDGMNLLGIVYGTEEYQTLVMLEKGRRKDQFLLSSSCSCPVGCDCKHGVAVIGKFLDKFAKNEPIPPCAELEDDVWETTSVTGKKTTLKIAFENDFDDDDDDFWDDDDDWFDDDDEEDEGDTPRKRIKKTTKNKTAKKGFKPETLRKTLQNMSQEELIKLILQLANDYSTVQEYFEQELFAATVSKSGKVDQIVAKAIEMIDKGIDYGDYGYYGNPSVDLRSVAEFVKQFQKFDDPLPGLDKVARHLVKKGKRYLEESGDEDDFDFRIVFEAIADVLLKSKSEPSKIITWSFEMSDLDEYDLLGEMPATISNHKWPMKVWSVVADELLAALKKKPLTNHDHWRLHKIVTTLDKVKRTNEATDFLRKEAPKIDEHETLVKRLIEVNCLEEAVTIATSQLQKCATSSQNRHADWVWMRQLKIIAEKRKDKATLASIQAAEFLHQPNWETIQSLLKSAKTLKVEPVIRKEMETFLQTGEMPEAVNAGLTKKEPTSAAKKNWPIPVFFFQPKPDQTGSQFDVLCKWAIREKRPHDVIRWYDELKSRQSLKRSVNPLDVAEAVLTTHPDRAFQFYRQAAEEEMNTTSTSHYPTAVSHLRRAKQALANAKRSGEWPKVLGEIRTKHGRKSSLMKQIDELEAGSIVKQRQSQTKSR